MNDNDLVLGINKSSFAKNGFSSWGSNRRPKSSDWSMLAGKKWKSERHRTFFPALIWSISASQLDFYDMSFDLTIMFIHFHVDFLCPSIPPLLWSCVYVWRLDVLRYLRLTYSCRQVLLRSPKSCPYHTTSEDIDLWKTKMLLLLDCCILLYLVSQLVTSRGARVS